jgi:plasmid stabilization system protein ParE
VADIFIHSDAEAEYEAALAWYLARSDRAAAGYEEAFERALASIAANPLLHPLYDDRHRFCLLRRYPYSIIYRLDGDQVRVLAVAHSRRLPGYWSGRT